MSERIRIVVVNEHTLGLQRPPSQSLEILHASILRGATGGYPMPEPTMIFSNDKVRLASAQDFDRFRVSFKGFDNPKEYEYQIK